MARVEGIEKIFKIEFTAFAVIEKQKYKGNKWAKINPYVRIKNVSENKLI